ARGTGRSPAWVARPAGRARASGPHRPAAGAPDRPGMALEVRQPRAARRVRRAPVVRVVGHGRRPRADAGTGNATVDHAVGAALPHSSERKFFPMTAISRRRLGAYSAAGAFGLRPTACGGTAEDASAGSDAGGEGAQSGSVEVEDNHGTHTVEVPPASVVATD